jgi:hypothetical protein
MKSGKVTTSSFAHAFQSALVRPEARFFICEHSLAYTQPAPEDPEVLTDKTFGFGYADFQAGDLVSIIHTCDYPIVLRKNDSLADTDFLSRNDDLSFDETLQMHDDVPTGILSYRAIGECYLQRGEERHKKGIDLRLPAQRIILS